MYDVVLFCFHNIILYVHWYAGVACDCCVWLCLKRSHDRPSLRSPTTQTAGREVHSAEPPLFAASAFTSKGGLATKWAQYKPMEDID